MRLAPFASLLLLAALGLSGCQTTAPEDRAAWERRPAVTVEGTGDYKRVEIKTRPGVILPFVFHRPKDARAVVVWFAGSTGVFGSLGFDRPLIEHGIAFAGIAPPTDLPAGYGEGGYRSRPEHVADIDAVVRWLRAETKLPVWLAGISMGSVSVAHVATRGSIPVDGVVFVATITGTTPSGRVPYDERRATDFPLAMIRVPVLAVAHRQDGCHSTPPAGAETILTLATGAPRKAILRFDGGMETGNPCGGQSHHTFQGMRDEVGAAIARFVLGDGVR